LRRLYQAAKDTSPTTFVNLDMEEYHDLELTTTVFIALLDEPEFRYHPLPQTAIRLEPDGPSGPWIEPWRRPSCVGCRLRSPPPKPNRRPPSPPGWPASGSNGCEWWVRSRLTCEPPPTAGVHLVDDPVTSDGRIELQHYLREQSISRTRHRYGNLV